MAVILRRQNAVLNRIRTDSTYHLILLQHLHRHPRDQQHLHPRHQLDRHHPRWVFRRSQRSTNSQCNDRLRLCKTFSPATPYHHTAHLPPIRCKARRIHRRSRTVRPCHRPRVTVTWDLWLDFLTRRQQTDQCRRHRMASTWRLGRRHLFRLALTDAYRFLIRFRMQLLPRRELRIPITIIMWRCQV